MLKVTAVILIIAGLVGLIWGGITLIKGVVAARVAAAYIGQMGGRAQGGEMMPGGEALPLSRANLGGAYNTSLGGLMGLVSLLLIGVGEVLWTLARLNSLPQPVVDKEPRL